MDKPMKIAELNETKERPILVFAKGKHVISTDDPFPRVEKRTYTLWTNQNGIYKATDKLVLNVHQALSTHPIGLSFSKDGTRLAFSTGQIYAVTEGKLALIRECKLQAWPLHCAPAFTSDGNEVAFNSHGVTVRDISTGVKVDLMSEKHPVHKLLFAPDDRHLLTGNANGTVYVLRLKHPPK